MLIVAYIIFVIFAFIMFCQKTTYPGDSWSETFDSTCKILTPWFIFGAVILSPMAIYGFFIK